MVGISVFFYGGILQTNLPGNLGEDVLVHLGRVVKVSSANMTRVYICILYIYTHIYVELSCCKLARNLRISLLQADDVPRDQGLSQTGLGS